MFCQDQKTRGKVENAGSNIDDPMTKWNEQWIQDLGSPGGTLPATTTDSDPISRTRHLHQGLEVPYCWGKLIHPARCRAVQGRAVPTRHRAQRLAEAPQGTSRLA
eukprot:6320529-Pyramimonas_sp.AAC.1